jgi:hypothetical protein
MGFKRVGSMCTKRREKREETSIPGGTDVNEVFVRSTPKPMSTGHRSRSDHVHTLSYILNPREVLEMARGCLKKFHPDLKIGFDTQRAIKLLIENSVHSCKIITKVDISSLN